MPEQTFRADSEGVVWKEPRERPGTKPGETIVSIGFPVCKMSEAAGDAAAEKIAILLNRGACAADLLRLTLRMVSVIEERAEKTGAANLVLWDFSEFLRDVGSTFTEPAAAVPHASETTGEADDEAP